jgi:hypothetical protein
MARVAGAAALAAVVAGGCGELQRQGRSPSFMIIDNLTAQAGGFTDIGNTLASDVITCVGNDPRVPTIFADGGTVSIRLGLKDQGSPSAPNTPTFANYITVTRYRVEFRRADGRNTPGVDVPHPFDGAITFTAVGGTTSATFVLVRAQAKEEAPLLNLRALAPAPPGYNCEGPIAGIGGALHIATLAYVTFYGHDQTGTPVSATGTISVTFADWGDPE